MTTPDCTTCPHQDCTDHGKPPNQRSRSEEECAEERGITAVALPTGKFAAILADPPWQFVAWAKGGRKAPDRHYSTMTPEDIMALPVSALAAEDCCLFLWATRPMIPEALAVIAAWGFTYKTEAFTWVKVYADKPRTPRMGLGYWTRANTEPCLLATRGHPKRLHKDVGQVIAAPIREHSRKPDETHERIERLVAGPYLELFARAPHEGWTVWGNETDKFAELTLQMEQTT